MLLFGMSAIAAIVHALLVGPPPSGPVDDGWAVDAADALLQEESIWVDSRSHEAYLENHYPGAFHLEFDAWDEGLAALLMEWDPDRKILVYCDGESCESSRMVAARLREELGVETVFWIRGGWPELSREDPSL